MGRDPLRRGRAARPGEPAQQQSHSFFPQLFLIIQTMSKRVKVGYVKGSR
jgi:hypothetical protein